jgi:hypothetical protein
MLVWSKLIFRILQRCDPQQETHYNGEEDKHKQKEKEK